MRIAITTNNKKKITYTLITITITILSLTLYYIIINQPNRSSQFDSSRAYIDVQNQLAFGPRTIGSVAHQETQKYIASILKTYGWKVESPIQNYQGVPIHNIIGKQGNGGQWVIIGAHYDSRISADRDLNPSMRAQPVPGANDGASGVAVLLELARSLPRRMNKTVWLVFFDAEDNGKLPGYDWILGSRAFADGLTQKPDQVIIVDMVGDQDLNILQEKNSDPQLIESIWHVAEELGHPEFISMPGPRILDDHEPFLEKGIPAVDIIDINYPYWHTTQDTLDKISANSLGIVGETLRAWLLQNEE